MSEDVYRKLQQRLDQYSLGFPATESGIEIKILRYLFSEKDAALFLALSPALETPKAVAARLERPVAEVVGPLEDMALRGLLFRLEKQGTVKYGAIPFVHGLFEFQVKNLSQELALMVEQYAKRRVRPGHARQRRLLSPDHPHPKGCRHHPAYCRL